MAVQDAEKSAKLSEERAEELQKKAQRKSARAQGIMQLFLDNRVLLYLVFSSKEKIGMRVQEV